MISSETFLLYDAAASAIFALLFWMAFPRRLKEPKWFVMFLLFCFSFFIPGLGIIGLSIGAVLLTFFRIKVKTREAETIEMPFFVREKIIQPLSFGESGGWTRARLKTASSSERIQSIAAVNAMASPQANLLNHSMLQDSSDELRLYAFSLLNKQGDSIDEHINQLKTWLGREKNPLLVAKLQKQMAMLYWELIYNKLVANELLNFTLEKTLSYATLALKVLPEDVGLWLLFGKIYIYQGKDDKALEAFERARSLHAPDEKTVPFLAELYFKKHDFDRVKELLRQFPVLKEVPKLGALIKFWCGDYETATSETV